MSNRTSSLLLGLTFAAGLTPAWSSPIQIQSVDLNTVAGYSTWAATPDLYQIATTTNGLDFVVASQRTTLSQGTTVQSAELRRSRTENTYTLSDDETDFSFQVDLFARHDASQYSLSTSSGVINFAATGDMTFGLAGNFNMQAGSVANSHYYAVTLLDVTTNQTIYGNSQYSNWTANEAFTLGQVGGDYGNSLTVPAAYNLVSGHQYQFSYSTWSQSSPYAVEGTSTGFVRFTAESRAPVAVAAVPEPATMALFGFGLLGFGFASFRRSRKK